MAQPKKLWADVAMVSSPNSQACCVVVLCVGSQRQRLISWGRGGWGGGSSRGDGNVLRQIYSSICGNQHQVYTPVPPFRPTVRFGLSPSASLLHGGVCSAGATYRRQVCDTMVYYEQKM